MKKAFEHTVGLNILYVRVMQCLPAFSNVEVLELFTLNKLKKGSSKRIEQKDRAEQYRNSSRKAFQAVHAAQNVED